MVEHIKYKKEEVKQVKEIRYVKFNIWTYRIIMYSVLFLGFCLGKSM